MLLKKPIVSYLCVTDSSFSLHKSIPQACLSSSVSCFPLLFLVKQHTTHNLFNILPGLFSTIQSICVTPFHWQEKPDEAGHLRQLLNAACLSSVCEKHGGEHCDSVCFCSVPDGASCLDAREVCSGSHGTEGFLAVPGGRAHRWWTLHNCSPRSNWRRCGPWSLYSGWVLGVFICSATHSVLWRWQVSLPEACTTHLLDGQHMFVCPRLTFSLLSAWSKCTGGLSTHILVTAPIPAPSLLLKDLRVN